MTSQKEIYDTSSENKRFDLENERVKVLSLFCLRIEHSCLCFYSGQWCGQKMVFCHSFLITNWQFWLPCSTLMSLKQTPRNLILLYTVVFQILKITSIRLLLSWTIMTKLSKVLTILAKTHPVTWFDRARHFSRCFFRRTVMNFDAGRYVVYLHSVSVIGSTFLKRS